jgi:hypothetical protein
VHEIGSGQVVAIYLFDVAESIDLAAVSSLMGTQAVAARLAPKSATPAYVQYEKPPLSLDGEAFDAPAIDVFRVRVRLYDYGVVSIALTRSFEGTWTEFTSLGPGLIENAELELQAEDTCRTVTRRLVTALTGHHQSWLSEDYLVFAVHQLTPPLPADAVIATHGRDIASLLRGERGELSDQEIAGILANRISYLRDDLVVPTWNAAFVYDTPTGTQAALDILEFANTQLLEYRYYDQLLDRELESIYLRLERPRWYEQWIGSRYTRAARQVHTLFIDVSELTDRTENAVKFIGDIYAVRLFRLAAERLALASWKADVENKLETLDDIYRFAVEQSGMARGTVLELTIVLILVLELVLFFAGVMR